MEKFGKILFNLLGFGLAGGVFLLIMFIMMNLNIDLTSFFVGPAVAIVAILLGAIAYALASEHTSAVTGTLGILALVAIAIVASLVWFKDWVTGFEWTSFALGWAVVVLAIIGAGIMWAFGELYNRFFV